MFRIVLKLLKEFLRIILHKRKIRQSYNLLKYRLSSKSEVLKYKPIYLTILPIHRCNLSCKMCLTHSKEIQDNIYRHKYFDDMTFEMFKDISSYFSEALAVGFMGNGEPLLNKDIFQMINFAEEKGEMRTSMITNGLILEQFIEKIISSSLNEISISINGHNGKEFSRMTGMPESHFQTIVAASKKLIERRDKLNSNLVIAASIVIDRQNLKFLQQMIDFADSIGFDHVSFYNILPLTKKRALEMSVFDSSETFEVFKKLKQPSSNITITLPIPLDSSSKNNICDDFFTSINIGGDGNIGGCNRQRFNISNSGKYSDKNVWNNEYFQSERRKFLNGELELDEPCVVCSANSSYIRKSIESFVNKG